MGQVMARPVPGTGFGGGDPRIGRKITYWRCVLYTMRPPGSVRRSRLALAPRGICRSPWWLGAVGAVFLAACAGTAAGAPPQPVDQGASASSGEPVGGQPTAIPTLAVGQSRQVPVPPDGKAYLGVQVQWQSDTPAAVAQRLGRTPAIFGRFVSFPMSADDLTQVDDVVSQVAAVHGKFFITLEPQQGLAAVTSEVAQQFAQTAAGWNAKGVDVFVRFGQEMNGSWYIWGQKPLEYVTAFRVVAEAVHTYAPRTVMVWSPNYGGGYPFPGEPYLAQPGSADFALLDTNHDGRITEADDPYTPYYPGDQYVDWVGITLYHFGDAWPWGKNIVAEKNKFVDQLTGHYNGANGNGTTVPDFYRTFAVGHHKPMALSETSALYNLAQAGVGSSDLAIKTDWIQQVFDPSFATRFPLLKMENWFEYAQPENGINGTIDWRATVDPQIVAVLRAALGSRFIFAG